MCRRSILERRREAPFKPPRCLGISYPVLAKLSPGYPKLEGRLPTCYSPVRHWGIAAPVRLACIRHAASVHPEPGSNSQLNLYSSSKLSDLFVLLKERRQVLVICLVFKDQRPRRADSRPGVLPRSSCACLGYSFSNLAVNDFLSFFPSSFVSPHDLPAVSVILPICRKGSRG